MAKRTKPKRTERTVQIVACIAERDAMILRHACGDAEADGKRWELSASVDGHPIVRLPDGRWVSFTWQSLVDAANAAGDEVTL